ncbi:MAG: hypothetical protein ACUVRG_10750 [Ignavibacterium sp.]|uniref:hypothetical protein n=1 Tax=Ignavibacterium sp. TaxID=2651167 RepID=UPI00404BA358
MKKDISFKLNLIISCVLVYATFFSVYAQQQNLIKSYNGIPIVTYARGVDSVQIYAIPPEQIDTIISSGVKFVQVENMTDSTYFSHLDGKDIFILPEQYFVRQNTFNKYITFYTEGRYTEWPTVGTDSSDGKATLKSLRTHTEKYGGLLRTIQTYGILLSHDTIVFGPQYLQDVYYRFHNDQDKDISYKVRYELMLEQLIPGDYSNTDTVCILQVTAKETYNGIFTTELPVYVISEKAVTIGELLPFNQKKIFEMKYSLVNVTDSISNKSKVHNASKTGQKNSDERINLFEAVKNIEFRIVWKSNSDVFRLYMDTIKVFDDRGWEIMNDIEAQQKIINQVTKVPYKDMVAGWMSVDEPLSIDQMAPIKKVGELIESVSPNTGLWVNYNCGWNGRFGNAADPGYTMRLERVDEFMRRVKKANIWVVMNPFDWPFCPDSIPNAKELNLSFIDSILSKLASAGNNYEDLYYGLCYQTGNYYMPVSYQQCSREITDYEFLYLSNLALLYGSKVLTPWLWFGSDLYYTGIVNANVNGLHTTDKYKVIKYILTPRLNGLMGKTLKKLKPLKQFVADSAMIYPYTVPKNYINKLICTTCNSKSSPPIFDIGFYYEPHLESTGNEKRYFILIDRYYPNRLYDKIKIEFKNLFNYRNWKFTNFSDSTSYSIIANANRTGLSNEITITKGDGFLLGLHPVVKYGGDLIASDTIKSNLELLNTMNIKNNVNLVIERGKYYTIKDTIILEGTGFITGKGYLNIPPGGEIKINNWNKSVFKGREENHPKIYWGKFPNIQNIISYKIYRKKGTTNFIHIASVSPNSPRYFIDTSVTIPDSPEAYTTFAEYKVTAIYQNEDYSNVESDYSNTIRYD